MTMKMMMAVAAMAAGMAFGADEPNDWENPAVNSRNRLPPRTYSMPLGSVQDALTDALEPASPYKMSLNGLWKLSWTGNPALRVQDFWKVNFDDSDWHEIDVPSCVELRGFGSPGYTNVRYPHKLEWPKILDRQSGKPDYNPVSSYRRKFRLPESWQGRRVILRFDGVYSAYTVWVNGAKVGYAEDAKLPSEFDVTPYLNVSAKSDNVLAVEVFRWCDGSYLEDQDMTRYSGIFRDVTLWSMPEDGIWDFVVKTVPVAGYERWRLEVNGVDGAEATLYDADGRLVGAFPVGGEEQFGCLVVPDARLWSAEKPYLYTLVLRKGRDIRMKRIGFKEQKIVGHTFLVNGKPVKFKGVNRHETSPENGRTVSLEEMVRDVTLMKRYNINTVRTSHYPDHHLWYDLCDRYGIYLCAEANVEGHEPGYGDQGLGRIPAWEHSIKERNLRHVGFYRNHPSVTLWSMGNETGHGDGFIHTIAAVKALDPSRPVHWERGNRDADVDSRMYPPVEWLEKRGQLGDGLIAADKMCEGDNPQSANKAFFMCEYAHAMGNAIGNFREYWDAFNKYESLSGGCIWDWIDQAVWKYTDRVDPKTGRRERFLSYGGDFDEQPNDGPFNCNGVIDPERHVTPKLIEVGHVHRNLAVAKKDGAAPGVYELWNRFCFTDADEFDGTWELVEDGVTVKQGSFDVPHLAPLTRGEVLIPTPEVLDADKEIFLNVRFRLKSDVRWAEKGWIVADDQVALSAPSGGLSAAVVKAGKPAVREEADAVLVTCGGTKAAFCRRSGTLRELEMNGVRVLKDPAEGIVAGPRLTCERAFTDNDIWLRGRSLDAAGTFYSSGLTQLRYHPHPIAVKDGKVRVVTDVTGSKSAGFVHEAEWSFGEDGSVVVSNVVTPKGTMPPALPRLGLSWRLDAALERMSWYGRGPHENYVDRSSGAFVGLYESTVTDQFVNYVRPQDNGYRSDVRWAAFVNAEGSGVKFSASEPLFVQALHVTAEDMEFARHRNGQQRFRAPLVPRPEVCLNLDVRQLGLGGNSCGPQPMRKYVFPVEKTAWTVRLEPFVR